MLTNMLQKFATLPTWLKIAVVYACGAVLSVRKAYENRIILGFTWGEVAIDAATFNVFSAFVFEKRWAAMQERAMIDTATRLGGNSTELFTGLTNRVASLETQISNLPDDIAKIVLDAAKKNKQYFAMKNTKPKQHKPAPTPVTK
jgi:hypothetical protein